jgi:hypothetical protein
MKLLNSNTYINECVLINISQGIAFKNVFINTSSMFQFKEISYFAHMDTFAKL